MELYYVRVLDLGESVENYSQLVLLCFELLGLREPCLVPDNLRTETSMETGGDRGIYSPFENEL